MTGSASPALGKKRGSKCNYCDTTTGLHTHHIIPRVLGGPDEGHNILTVCKDHHWQLHGIHEKTTFSELTKAGIAKAKQRGVVFGNRTNLMEASKKGAAAVKAKADAFALRARGVIQAMRGVGMSFHAIAQEFNNIGVPTAGNGIWYGKTVSNILTRPV